MSNIIFPHFEKNKKQRKEIPYIYCFNLKVVNSDPSDREYIEYLRSLTVFINQNKNVNLMSSNVEEAAHKYRGQVKQAFKRENYGNSVFWKVDRISSNEKEKMDKILINTSWKGSIDKLGYIVEGCLYDDKIFIGGKKELEKFYCGLFPEVSFCKKYRNKKANQALDSRLKLLFDNTETNEKLLDYYIKSIDHKESDFDKNKL